MNETKSLNCKFFLPTQTYQIDVCYYLPKGIFTFDQKRDTDKFLFDNERDWRKKEVEISNNARVEWFSATTIHTVTSVYMRE